MVKWCLETSRDRLGKNSQRNFLAVAAGLLLAFFLMTGVLYLIEYSNADCINDKLCAEDPTLCAMVDDNVYNVGFLLWGEWTDD
mmetsp:Transcript_13786/g.17436  ORF Transcript_13786/g.17436 Transcript_13786/m.17436 type:complete len:84 (-) Transcript_13786:580-831(-)